MKTSVLLLSFIIIFVFAFTVLSDSKDKPNTKGKAISLQYRFKEGGLLSYSLSSKWKTKGMSAP